MEINIKNLIGKLEIHYHINEPQEVVGLGEKITEILSNAVADISQVPSEEKEIPCKDKDLCNEIEVITTCYNKVAERLGWKNIVIICSDDTQTQDTRLCNADRHFQEESSKDLPSSPLLPNCDTEKKNKYQDPTLAHLHRMCMLLDAEAQRIEASYKARPHLSRRNPERLERDFVSDVRSLVGHLSDRIFPYVQRSLDDNKNQHS